MIEFVNHRQVASDDAAAGASAAAAREFAFLWLIVLIYILARGGGPYSVDAKLGHEF